MANIISCRVGVFGKQDEAFRRLPQADVFHAEASPPEDGNYQALADTAKRHGVTIATLATGLHLNTDETAAEFRPVIDGAAAIGVPKVFCSVKPSDDGSRETSMRRLSETVVYAAERGITLCMETHPPFGTNGDVIRQTMAEVKSPGLMYNFDTANIYYYNEGMDAVAEVRKAADLVGAVHLKDTDGGFKSGNFPPVGKGIVDYASIFKILGEHGFEGPYTFEIEGGLVKDLDQEQRVDFLRECVAYLRSIGVMD